MKVFLDTNVLVAAFATRGLCADVVRLVLAGHEWLVSETVLAELEDKLVAKLMLPHATVRSILAFVKQQALVVDAVTDPPPVAVRDPDDAVILAEALAAETDLLVTGDRDLLDLPRLAGIEVVTPRGFWERMTREPEDR